MESVDFMDRRFDPPEIKTHEECKRCREEFDNDDIDDNGHCPDCAKQFRWERDQERDE